jgi:Protein of unknown function (DUF1003)
MGRPPNSGVTSFGADVTVEQNSQGVDRHLSLDWSRPVRSRRRPGRALASSAVSEHRRAEGHHGAFGEDAFGRFAEKTARFFGTPQYIVGQTIVVASWIIFNVLAFTKEAHFDVRPFILLNLIFSTQDKDLTEQVAELTKQIHELLTQPAA